MFDETTESSAERLRADDRGVELEEFQRAWTELINAAIHARSRGGHGHRGAEDLTLTQALLMEAVRGMNGPSVGAVAHVVGVSSPSATRMIQQLERKGMMARRRSERDERSTVVTITEEGERTLALHRRDMEAKQRRVFEAIRPSLRPVVLELLRDLRDAIDDT
ncbi:MarR family winged helix-turn-helix transcriptional regulator [Nocardiopsis lambiniae]|uniref:MarR family winged helix-turn-helix transcriptional regulator n=1 Tax=Nocardiopsis lambiniae TaxID=3075539 RepID=A0ABU2M493_9ACTN|nr:MarR family winged helix-turn-helix transcriptional regulator [Nocardiopsis sp. DSM 44743]MDT0327131.1 MarR family winged helix-turn-helix transcriptional regulator [Nocardiopsis sp. DSM 44743]